MHQIRIMINRKNAEMSAVSYKMTKANSINRKARTRTLIQLGNLVSISGLSSLLNIQEGDDLQSDLISKDKAAMLLGAISEIMEGESPSPLQQERWLDKGIRLLKMREYQKRL